MEIKKGKEVEPSSNHHFLFSQFFFTIFTADTDDIILFYIL